MFVSRAYDQIDRINRRINASTRYRPDVELYGRIEFWEVAQGAGDCEDYALAKRAALLAEGFPAEDLRLATVFTETEEGRQRMEAGKMGDHAVLIAATPEGDYILDNRFEYPMLLRDTQYTMDRVQVAGTSNWETAHGDD